MVLKTNLLSINQFDLLLFHSVLLRGGNDILKFFFVKKSFVYKAPYFFKN